MTSTDPQQRIRDLEAEVEHLRAAVGAIMLCLVRVGIEGRAPLMNDVDRLGMDVRLGTIGIPDKAAAALHRYRHDASALEG